MVTAMITPSSTIALIGFGKVGSVVGAELAARGYSVRAYDMLLDDIASRDAMLIRMAVARVSVAQSLQDAMHGAKLVIAAATSAAANSIRSSTAALLVPGQVLLEADSLAQALSALGINATTGIAYDQKSAHRGELP
jgi:3-hydroxyisobutyrate dehydrogenase-like beta-hydroxyacid dehydrogenase